MNLFLKISNTLTRIYPSLFNRKQVLISLEKISLEIEEVKQEKKQISASITDIHHLMHGSKQLSEENSQLLRENSQLLGENKQLLTENSQLLGENKQLLGENRQLIEKVFQQDASINGLVGKLHLIQDKQFRLEKVTSQRPRLVGLKNHLKQEVIRIEDNESITQTPSEKHYIFTTARYRTGSTYLYSLFSSLNLVDAYLEPLHPLLLEIALEDEAIHKEIKIHQAHTITGNYFQEFKELNWDRLCQLHSKEFSTEKLFLGIQDDFYELKNYVSFLTSNHSGNLGDTIKVFQFNRIDYRLSWLRYNFPQALIINLRRNPRDVYTSYLKHANKELLLDKSIEIIGAPTSNADIDLGNSFYTDEYIFALGKILSPQICVQELHPYEKIYLLNRLSNIWADHFSHISIDYENLVHDPEGSLRNIMSHIKGYSDFSLKSSLIPPNRNSIDSWKDIESNSWFQRHESNCEFLIDKILSE